MDKDQKEKIISVRDLPSSELRVRPYQYTSNVC